MCRGRGRVVLVRVTQVPQLQASLCSVAQGTRTVFQFLVVWLGGLRHSPWHSTAFFTFALVSVEDPRVTFQFCSNVLLDGGHACPTISEHGTEKARMSSLASASSLCALHGSSTIAEHRERSLSATPLLRVLRGAPCHPSPTMPLPLQMPCSVNW